jgi:hypothetical protein
VFCLIVNLFEQSQSIYSKSVAAEIEVNAFSLDHLSCLVISLSYEWLLHQLNNRLLDIGHHLVKHGAFRLSVFTLAECLDCLFIKSGAECYQVYFLIPDPACSYSYHSSKPFELVLDKGTHARN